jgi:aryl-alcohol dehydrogenase-like predicted oxidoreductase
MQHRFLGRTGVRVSALAFGTMPFGKDAALDADLFAMALDAGVNLFDCADVYNEGAAETSLGRLIATCRDRIVLTTKAYFPTGPDGNARGSSRFHLVRAVEASLRRLATDRIDVFFLHRFDEATALDETLRAVEHLVASGKILYPAVSNFAAWQTARALGIAERHGWQPLVCVQPMYNLAKRQAEVEILPLCRAEKLGALTYSPLGGGLLTGRYAKDVKPDDGRLVKWPMYKTRYGADDYYELAERFTAFARDRGHDPSALAIAWAASHPDVTAAILGARTREQLAPCLRASEIAMTPELRAEISVLAPAPAPATDRNEEGVIDTLGSR